jgi:hypothetical protein
LLRFVVIVFVVVFPIAMMLRYDDDDDHDNDPRPAPPPLIAPSHPSCSLVGCCVKLAGAPASLPLSSHFVVIVFVVVFTHRHDVAVQRWRQQQPRGRSWAIFAIAAIRFDCFVLVASSASKATAAWPSAYQQQYQPKMFHKSRLGLIFTFWQKRNVFLMVPLQSVQLFWAFLPKRNIVPVFWNAGTAGFWGILGIPAGMHNLASLGNKTVTSSNRSCISSTSFGIQII